MIFSRWQRDAKRAEEEVSCCVLRCKAPGAATLPAISDVRCIHRAVFIARRASLFRFDKRTLVGPSPRCSPPFTLSHPDARAGIAVDRQR